MTALPVGLTSEEPPPPRVTRPSARVAPVAELTLRALIAGAGIGIILAAGNVYTGLKTGFIDSGSLTATLVSFAVFAGLRRFGPRAFTPFENNIAQTVAASAAVMAFVHGVMGPIPALRLMGATHPLWALWTWGLALGIIGMLIGAWSRRKLIIEEALPFPSGSATAATIRALHANATSATRPVRFLLATAALGAAVAWFRDGAAAFLPQGVYLPLTIAGLAASSLTLGLAVSPLTLATGIFIGVRGCLTLFATGVVAWGVVAPVIVHTGVVKDAGYASVIGWLVWPAFGMMLGGSVAPLVSSGRRQLLAAWHGLRTQRERQPMAASPQDGATRRARALTAATLVAAVALLVWTGQRAFDLSPLTTLGALVVAVVLAGVCARAVGETDIAPVGNMGTLTQVLFAHGGPATSILAGAVASGNATQTAQALWSFKAGADLRASIRAQTIAQLVGVVVGSLVVVPTYAVIVDAIPLATERMPAVSALSWRATSEAVAGGLASLPRHGLQAAVVAFVLGLGLSLTGRLRWGRHLPSPVTVGIALITPASMAATMLLGAAGVAVARRRFASFSDADAHALGAGALAGESIVAILVAILTSAGVLH
ncbi:MAG TPA: OPT/YSL family transporter [Polyangia bacterium]|nr:OPT/YSL family transporter [Polyangia bacterium]